MPLLGEYALAYAGTDQLRVAVFDVTTLEEFLRDVEDLAAGAFGSLDEEGVGRIGHLLLDLQTGRAQRCMADFGVRRIGELDEEILGVEHRLMAHRIDQDAAR